jgi:hypothetical protein
LEITRKKREVPSKRLAETMQKTYDWEEEETNNNKSKRAGGGSRQASNLPPGGKGGRLMCSRRFCREEAGEESTNPTAASSLGNGMAVALSPLHGSTPLSPLWSITGSVIKLVVAKGKSKNIPAMNFSLHLLLLLLLHVLGNHSNYSNYSNLHHQLRSKNFAE